jgi:hypothetical protein
MPGSFNKACSTYFGGHYRDLYSESSGDESSGKFTTGKAMTFLKRARGQAFLAEREEGVWSFPCEVVRVGDGGMAMKQWIPEGSKRDFLEPELKDTEIYITLEPEILAVVYECVAQFSHYS